MKGFGTPGLATLSTIPEGGVSSYGEALPTHNRPESKLTRLLFLLRANYAYNYINALRKRSNDPLYIARGARIERMLKHPLHTLLPKTERAAGFLETDFHIEHSIVDPGIAARFAAELTIQKFYDDPYVPSFRHEGSPETATHPFLYMDAAALLKSEAFLALAATQGIIDFCREALGPSAALTWAWAWISMPGQPIYENQKWHRDNSEPFNFIRVFIPLSDVESMEDGPTQLLPGTSQMAACYALKRYNDEEVAPLREKQGIVTAFCKPGDAYFVNTFALHRGNPPAKPRAMLTLLVSLSPSHRTPAIPRTHLRDLSPELRERIQANAGFFRHILG